MTNQPNDNILMGSLALALAAKSLDYFANYIKSLDPELLDSEALSIAIKFIELLPELCNANPNIIDRIHAGCRAIKRHRPNQNN